MANDTEMVIFDMHKQRYAVDISVVGRIIGYKKPTPMPQTSDYIVGVITYEGKVLPIIDLNKRFYNEYSKEREEIKILIINWEDYNLGFLVEEVSEIKAIDNNNIQKTPSIVEGENNDYIKGLIKQEDEILIYLKINEIFKGLREEELSKLIKES